MTQAYKYLHFIKNSIFFLWDPKRLSLSALKYRYNTIPLKDVLSVPKMEWIDIEDDKDYPILGVHAQGEGVYINRIAKGKELTMKQYQRSKPMHLFYCKVRTVNGQWGIVYPEFSNSYGSSNMQYLSISQEKLNPSFLELLLRVKSITQEWDKNAVGADGRHFPLKTLLNLQIPLPSLEEQNKIVAAYNATIVQADILSAQAQNIDGQIQNYIQKELGIESKKEEKNNQPKGFLHIFNFHQLWDRWDMLNTSSVIFDKLSISKYQIVTLGSTFKCVMRSWKKEGTTFNYIEMGCVNPSDGIIESQTIETKKAPSRATQIVHAGDLIIGTTRPYLKRFAIVTEQYHNNVCSSAFQVIAPNITYNLHFLHEFLLTSFAVEQFEHYMTGALYPAITNKDLKKIQIPLPPLAIQNEIVNHITALRAEQKNLQQQASDLRLQAQQQFEQTIFN